MFTFSGRGARFLFTAQTPARASNRGGGLVIYIIKKLCELSDIKVKHALCCHDNPKIDEFLVAELT